MTDARIFISPDHNPYCNLAWEQALLNFIRAPTLFLYQNTPCVVIGRAQNPWVEADVSYLQTHHIPLVRRQSGGGTVVHDLGNLNFSFLSPKKLFNKAENLQLICDALQSLAIEVSIGGHHDLLLHGKKISGSAFRETKENCFHHGTLLVDSDLTRLRRCLQVPPLHIVSQAIPSRRSSVNNLIQARPSLTVRQVEHALIKAFSNRYLVHDIENVADLGFHIEATQTRYESDEWIYHHTLPFSEGLILEDETITLKIEAGYIINIVPPHPKLKPFLDQPYLSFYNSHKRMAGIPFKKEGKAERELRTLSFFDTIKK